MTESDVISQLKSLREVEPNENWVVSVREEILTKAPHGDAVMANYFEKPSKMDNLMYIYESISRKYRLVPSLASMSVILLIGSFITVTAAKTSLPGDALYAVKIANEDLMLAVASDDDKPGVEMEYAGKRLEELAEISKKASDAGQQQKVEQLVQNFEQKVVSANDKMAKISQSTEKKKVAKVAKQFNNQTEKYSELLAKTSENLPSVVKDKITDKIASALSATEKANMDALLILVESNQQIDEKEISDEELTEIILKKVDEINENTATAKNASDAVKIVAESAAKEAVEADSARSSTNEAEPVNEAAPADPKAAIMESITENLNNNNLIEAVKRIAEAQKIDNTINPVPVETTEGVVEGAQNTAEGEENAAVTTETATNNDVKTDNAEKVNNVITPVPVE